MCSSCPVSGVIFEKSYLGSVTAMRLNGLYAAVLYDGKIQLHAVSIGRASGEGVPVTFAT